MNKRILILACLAALASATVLAHPGARARARAAGRCVEISEAQKTAIRNLRVADREASRALRDELRAAALEYRRLADRNDAAAGRALERFRDLREQSVARRMALRMEVGNVLTPEQRQRLEQCREERRERRR